MHTQCTYIHASPRKNDHKHTNYLHSEKEASYTLFMHTALNRRARMTVSILLIHEYTYAHTCIASLQLQLAYALFTNKRICAYMNRFASTYSLFIHIHMHSYMHCLAERTYLFMDSHTCMHHLPGWHKPCSCTTRMHSSPPRLTVFV